MQCIRFHGTRDRSDQKIVIQSISIDSSLKGGEKMLKGIEVKEISLKGFSHISSLAIVHTPGCSAGGSCHSKGCGCAR